MAVTAIVGGQFGSEGKGKIASYLAPEFVMAIRTGGPNAGHKFHIGSKTWILRTIPCAVIEPKCLLGIGAGGVINPNILFDEIAKYMTSEHRLIIDPQAGIIDPIHLEISHLIRGTYSTTNGVGPSIAHKAIRIPSFRLARDLTELSPYIGDVSQIANELIDDGKSIMLEGCQGLGLSLNHGYYPYVASRDTTVGMLCADSGLSVRLVKDIILVIRTFPIRAGSGPLEEITWDDIARNSGSPTPIIEYTTVTKRIRRVGKLDIEFLHRAIRIERPTQIALTFADYINHEDFGKNNYSALSTRTQGFIEELEKSLGVPITLISTGPDNSHIIDLRGQKL